MVLKMKNKSIKWTIVCISSLLMSAQVKAAPCPLVDSEPPLFSFSVDQIAKNIDFDDNVLFRKRHYKTCPPIGERYGTWVEGFIGHLQQDAEDRNGIGYGAHGRGLVIGVDRRWCPNFRAGFAYAFSKANGHTDPFVETDLENSLNINSQQGLVFARYQICDIYYSGTASFALNVYSQDRNSGLEDKSRFTGWQFNGKVEAGYEFNRKCYGMLYHLMPYVNFDYRHLSTHAHQDIDGFSFETEPLDYANLGLGVLFSLDHRSYMTKWGQLTPYARFVLTHAVLYDGQETFVHFGGVEGTSCVLTGIEPSQYGRMWGLGVSFDFKNNNYLSLEYDYESKSRYHMSSGFIKYRFEWC